MHNESKGMLFGLLGVVAFGLTLPASRHVVPYMDPIFIGLGRAVVAALFAAIILLVTRQQIPTQQQLVRLLIIAAGVVVGFPVLSAWAMQSVPASHGGVVLGLLPLATAIVGVLISNDRPSQGFWLTGVAGSVLVVAYSLLRGSGAFQIGDLALLGAIISAAVSYAVGGELSKSMGGWQVICWALIISFPLILIPAVIKAPEDLFALPPDILLSFLYLALVSQLLGFFLWNKGLALGGVARVSQTQLIQPFVTIIASVLLLGETLDSTTLVFALLVVGTVAVGKHMRISKNRGT
jgi:drug/metabolite transporter (DMT)-like permease